MLYQRVSVPSTDGFSLPLDVYCPEVYPEIDPDIQRPAVVICPGGAYRYLSPREAEPVALVFAAMGFNAFVAGYRVRAPLLSPSPAGCRRRGGLGTCPRRGDPHPPG